MVDGEEKVNLSSDFASATDGYMDNNSVFSPEFINMIKYFGFLKHELKLTINAPVMLLKNIDEYVELRNGTRRIVNQLGLMSSIMFIIGGNVIITCITLS